MKKALAVAAALVLPILVLGQGANPHPYVPPNGFVPDSLTAVRVAVAIWTPIYGEKQIASEGPYRAVLRGDVWTVTGHLPLGYVGGGAEAELSRRDARILRVGHGK
ncbi:MAG TPA: NTF2 fold immunity protein [Gemmatimonadaceae bacterium]|jgi:hypothetical protein